MTVPRLRPLPHQAHIFQPSITHRLVSFSYRPPPCNRATFGDSSYFTTALNRGRLLAASAADLRSLPADEFDKMRAGMKDKMGVEEFQRWNSLLSTFSGSSESGSATMQSASRSSGVPEFVRTVQERYATGTWGFVVFRSAGYGLSREEWYEKRGHIEAAIREPFEHCPVAEGVKDVVDRFRLEWVEDERFAGDVELVARRYGEGLENGTFIQGLDHPSLCLNVTLKALDSIDKSGRKGKQQFIQVVAPISTDGEYEENTRQLANEHGETYPTHFNIALGSVLDSLFYITARQLLTMGEIGGHLGEDDVWAGL